MAKSELGTKRTCLKCNVKFYDLNKEDIHCPECGTSVNENTESNVPDIEVLQDAVTPEKSDTTVPLDSAGDTNNIPDLIEVINNPELEDNPILIDDDDSEEEEEEEEEEDDIISNIDIPELENDDLADADEDPFLVEDDDDNSDIVIKKPNDDE